MSSCPVFVLCVVTLACTAALQPPRKFPNLGFLGRGYDIYRSNPRASSRRMDPGYVAPVLDPHQYSRSRLSGDDRYLLPDRVDSMECKSCQQTFQFHQIKSADDLKRTAGTTVTASYKGVIVGAKTSSSHQEVVQTNYETNNVFVDAYATCSSYCASLQWYQFNASDLTLNFRNAVHELCANELSVEQFLWIFGTHYITKVQMGSLFWQRTTFTSEDWEKMTQTTNINEHTLRVGVMKKREKTTGSKEETYTDETFTAKSLSRDIITIGTELNRTSSWLYVSDQQPMPIRISIHPIITMLTRRVFPDEINLHVKRQAIVEVLENKTYCEYLMAVQGLTGECYGLTKKEILKPAEKIPFVLCPDFFGGHYSYGFSGFLGTNHLTHGYKCSNDYSANKLIETQDYSKAVYYCTNSDTPTNYGGMYSIITTRSCHYRERCKTQGLFICWKKETVFDYYTDAPSGQAEAYGYRTFGNVLLGDSKSCRQDFQKVLLGRFDIGYRIYPCTDGPVYIDVIACYNRGAFVQGQSYVGGFYGQDANPQTGQYNCPQGYSSHQILAMPGNGRNGYSCIRNESNQ